MQREDKAILSTFAETFKSFQSSQITQPLFKYDPDATVIMNGVNEILFNSVCIKNPLDQEKLIKEFQAFHHILKKPLTIWLTPETQADGLEEKLKEQFETPGYFCGMLLDLKKAHLFVTPNTIKIIPVANQQDANYFAKIYCEVFGFPNLLEYIEKWVRKQYEADPPICINYLAKIDDSVAGVCSLVVDKNFKDFNTGGLYNACVLPKYRKMGVATAMANYRIEVAKTLGLDCLSIILMSDAMARGYCEKIGFQNYMTMIPFFLR
jgi:GNAT superfamily N-acetyltransferase